jgi:hypothetical protein
VVFVVPIAGLVVVFAVPHRAASVTTQAADPTAPREPVTSPTRRLIRGVP